MGHLDQLDALASAIPASAGLSPEIAIQDERFTLTTESVRHELLAQPSADEIAAGLQTTVDHFVRRFNELTRKTAESIVSIGQLVLEAKHVLPATEYKRFTINVGINNSSTVRKYERIGDMGDIFAKNLELLPPSWTSLYELSKLSPKQLENELENGGVWSQMTGKDIRDLLLRNGIGEPCSSLNISMRIDFAAQPTGKTLAELERTIKDFLVGHELDAKIVTRAFKDPDEIAGQHLTS
jgi:hypothetical protein